MNKPLCLDQSKMSTEFADKKSGALSEVESVIELMK